MNISMLTGRPTAPVEVADAVELWARESGRHARLEWHEMLLCWVVHLTRRPGDPVLREWREGRLAQEPTESFQLREPAGEGKGYRPMNLEEYGAEGVVTVLRRADTWSGRGEYQSLEDAVVAAVEQEQANERRIFNAAYEAGYERGDMRRRKTLGLPFVTVPANLPPN